MLTDWLTGIQQSKILDTASPQTCTELYDIIFYGESVGSYLIEEDDFMLVRNDLDREDPEERFKSAKKLLNFVFDAIFPFHYEPLPRNAKTILSNFIHRYEHNRHQRNQ